MTYRDIQTLLFILGGAGSYLFSILYVMRSAPWRSEIGRNMLSMMLCLAGLFTLVVFARMIGPLPRPVWYAGLGALDAIIWWRVIILWRRQREDRRSS